MKEYKCISCGEVKQCDERCTCPVCGYGMYEMPFERAELLRGEIISFLKHIIVQNIQPEEIVFDGKKNDDERFPSYNRILNYVFAAEKTEDFCERLNDTASQLKKHYHKKLVKEYRADLSQIRRLSESAADQLKQAAEALGIETPETFPAPHFPEITLKHSEIPDDMMLSVSDRVIDRLTVLSEKIYKFIVRNNMFSSNREVPDIRKHGAADIEEVTKCLDRLDTVIAKEYVIDILDDGLTELNEMLGTYFKSLSAVMSLPVFQINDHYGINGVYGMTADDCIIALSRSIAERFKSVTLVIKQDNFLKDKSENTLFMFYDKMLSLDHFNYMNVKKGDFKIGENERKLDSLIGLDSVKNSVLKIKAFAAANKGREDLNLHMCFLGNPGTGKTEVARVIAGILYENGILPTDKVIETDRSGLVAGYVGHTALKTNEIIEEAMGGVLFIDEAYALIQKDTHVDFGHEAVATLIKAMEDKRGKFCVILAGYRNPMLEMLSTNQGFKSRIQFTIDFPNYSRDEIGKIAGLMLEKISYTMSEAALHKMLDITDIRRKSPDFANAREVRNIIDQVIMCHSVRCAGTENRELELVDVNTYIKDNKINLPTGGNSYTQKVLTTDEELDALVGLANVKRMVKKIRAYARRNKADGDFNMHMCFCGNPGTGKTETARIISRILYEAGALPEAKLVETDAHGLMGKYVGETAPKTLAKINDAMGGVLFIDEAYALTESSTTDGKSTTYGDEAIAVLLKEMENRRGQFCVILAGYTNEMKAMVSSNPGLASRVQFTLDFPDFTREELSEIALRMLEKKKYTIADNALSLLLDVCEYYRRQPDFANARTVRNLLDQVIMNQNLRADEEGSDSREILISDVEDYIADEGIDLTKNGNNQRKIGF